MLWRTSRMLGCWRVCRLPSEKPNEAASLVTESLFALVKRDFAPLEQRMASAIAREALVPVTLRTAKDTLKDPPRVFVEIALDNIDGSIDFFKTGLPKAFVGVVIALIVLMPEGLAAIKSALRNRLQNSISLALGSAIASIGLTIPTVALVSIVLNRQIALGVSQTDMTLLILTLYIAALTLGTGRTTVLQGAVHLVIFAAFMLVSAVP